jgi:hypothetical protein
MKFTPKTEAEIREAGLLPAGEYPFEVIDAQDTQSKAGNEMISLKLRVWRPDGTTVQMRDWLLDAIEYKLRHFCDTTGLLAVYGLGDLTADHCIGKTGTVKVGVQDDDKYGPQNAVKDYTPAGAAVAPAKVKVAAVAVTQPADDDIPF